MVGIKKNRKELRKLIRRVEKLEEQVEQLKKRTGDNEVRELITWTVAVLEIATAIIALIAALVG